MWISVTSLDHQNSCPATIINLGKNHTNSMKHAQNECKRYNYVDVTPKPESRLLLRELLQCCVSKETTMGDGPASNTELCYIPKWFSFILNRVRTNEMKQKVVKRGGRSVTDRGPLGNCNRRRPCSETCLLWFTCCAQLCTLVVKKKCTVPL